VQKIFSNKLDLFWITFLLLDLYCIGGAASSGFMAGPDNTAYGGWFFEYT
jgi:hypothetical protein